MGRLVGVGVEVGVFVAVAVGMGMTVGVIAWLTSGSSDCDWQAEITKTRINRFINNNRRNGIIINSYQTF